MKIYTGLTNDPNKIKKIKQYNLGIMISSSYSKQATKPIPEANYALDNGAFSCYQKGYPFNRDLFLWALDKAFRKSIILDFIVCPDIVCGGKKSLEFSMKWATNELLGTPNLALVVQDGMQFNDILYHHKDYFSYIFVGGSKEWKWETAEGWKNKADKLGMKLHIGRCGTIEALKKAKEIGSDSVDSTSFTRNNSWHILEEFLNNKQNVLALKDTKEE